MTGTSVREFFFSLSLSLSLLEHCITISLFGDNNKMIKKRVKKKDACELLDITMYIFEIA